MSVWNTNRSLVCAFILYLLAFPLVPWHLYSWIKIFTYVVSCMHRVRIQHVDRSFFSLMTTTYHSTSSSGTLEWGIYKWNCEANFLSSLKCLLKIYTKKPLDQKYKTVITTASLHMKLSYTTLGIYEKIEKNCVRLKTLCNAQKRSENSFYNKKLICSFWRAFH